MAERGEIVMGLMERVAPDVSERCRESLEDRLAVHRSVYFMEEFGIPFGYTFRGGFQGPYSPQLSGDIQQVVHRPRGEPLQLKNAEYEARFKKFEAFIKPLAGDGKKLMHAARVHDLYSHGLNEATIGVRARSMGITEAEFKEACEVLEKHELLPKTS